MLTPVTDHEAQAKLDKWYKEHERGCPGIDGPHVVEEDVAAYLGDEGADGEVGFVLAVEVEGELGPDEKKEASHVMQEIEEIVALVANCC